jgi:formate dehydrogenase maturation protein FdhE
MDLIIECVDSIFDADAVYDRNEMSKDELTDFIDNLNSGQFKKVQAFFQDIPAVEHTVKMKCSNCGKDNDIELRGLQSFFS